MISPLNQSEQQLSQKLKINKMFAAQVHSNVLEKRYGVRSCCPPSSLSRALELSEYRELLEYFFPDNPKEKGCILDIECADLLTEKINTL